MDFSRKIEVDQIHNQHGELFDEYVLNILNG